MVGEYELKHDDGNTFKMVFLKNGEMERYRNGKKEQQNNWSIVNGEIHVDSGGIYIWRINKDGSITFIANIKDGKQTDFKKAHYIYKKIK